MTITSPMWLRQMKNMMLSLDLCAKDVRAILAANSVCMCMYEKHLRFKFWLHRLSAGGKVRLLSCAQRSSR